MSERPHTPGTTAVVIGAGIAGLVAARVLADHFTSVVVLEADALPPAARPRRGTPQARHQHGLLAGAAAELQRLFPGLQRELAAAGAPLFDFGRGTSVTLAGRRLPRTPMDLSVQAFSRDLLEWTLRRRLLTDTPVDVRDRCRVEGLSWNHDASQVTGVRLEGARTIGAAWVVDASGRFSALPDWLEHAGHPRPVRKVTDADLVYATTVLRAPAQDFDALFQPYRTPGQPRGGFAARLEHGNWLVTLFGAGGDHPPHDAVGWRKFAASLRNPDLDHLLASAAAASDSTIHTFRRTENRLTQYPRSRRWPAGLVAVGDSVAAHNPAFGQGMSAAVLQARIMAEHLTRAAELGRAPSAAARPLQRHITRLARKQWIMTAADDLVWQYHGRHRPPPLWLRPLHWYKERLLRLAATDQRLYALFIGVFHELLPPRALTSPHVVARVLLAPGGRTSRTGGTRAP
ncbi:FAD-dependent monooxygenase [Streptomyces sp. CC224B]|uniref:FAD-dependent oxidoreductase n=1 Tax=Streptomyces sp. CC224B TaxID=3044571 RepID=UPI0024A81DF8|nr:FAD-dependent monooxygenase [Streptomyces sp. CC224B]